MSYSDAERYRIYLEERMDLSRVTICAPYAIDCLLTFSLVEVVPTNWYEKAVEDQGAFPSEILQELENKGLVEHHHQKHPSGDLRKAMEDLKRRIGIANLGTVFVENGRIYDHAFSVRNSPYGGVLVYDLKHPFEQRTTHHEVATRVIVNGSPDHDMYVVKKGLKLR